jgi:hypothetical protein
MNNKGFVFTGMAFLLVIPAIMLAASYMSMIKTGEKGTEYSLTSDVVLYTQKNIIDFLVEGAKAGKKDKAIDDAKMHAQRVGLNLTIAPVNLTYYLITTVTESGIVYNITIELLKSTIMNLTLDKSDYNRSETIYMTANVTYTNGSAVSGANVTAGICWGIVIIQLQEVSPGIYNGSYPINASIISVGPCSIIGIASGPAEYISTDTESCNIIGILNITVFTDKPSYTNGSIATVSVNVTDDAGIRISNASVNATITSPGDINTTLSTYDNTLIEIANGTYSGNYTTFQTGMHYIYAVADALVNETIDWYIEGTNATSFNVTES